MKSSCSHVFFRLHLSPPQDFLSLGGSTYTFNKSFTLHVPLADQFTTGILRNWSSVEIQTNGTTFYYIHTYTPYLLIGPRFNNNIWYKIYIER